MRAADICAEAGRLVAGDRARHRGDVVVSFATIAHLWNAWLDARRLARGADMPLEAEDVATMMELLKIARRLGGRLDADDYVDGAGYAACAGEIAHRVTATRTGEAL